MIAIIATISSGKNSSSCWTDHRADDDDRDGDAGAVVDVARVRDRSRRPAISLTTEPAQSPPSAVMRACDRLQA
jgi:hypothetical protein